MCRMLAAVSVKPLDLRLLMEFRELAEKGKVSSTASEPGHRAGWGIVVYELGKPTYVARQPTNAAADAGYVEACRRLGEKAYRGIVLVHLRKASLGKICEENTHPFTFGRWAFAHNGTVEKLEPPEGLPLEGQTDSERLFKHIVAEALGGQSLVEALASTVRRVRSRHRFSSLTFMMSDGERLYGYREFSRDADYYTLYCARTDGAVLLCQEPIGGFCWQELGNRTLVCVNSDLSLEVTEI